MVDVIRRKDVVAAIRRKEDGIVRLQNQKQEIEQRIALELKEKSELVGTLDQFEKIAAALHAGAAKTGKPRGRSRSDRTEASGTADRASPRTDVRKDSEPERQEAPQAKPKSRRGRQSELSTLIRRLIAQQTDHYTGPQILEQLAKIDEAMAKRIPEGYMSSLLWRMAQAQEIQLVRKGAPGLPNVYCNPR